MTEFDRIRQALTNMARLGDMHVREERGPTEGGVQLIVERRNRTEFFVFKDGVLVPDACCVASDELQPPLEEHCCPCGSAWQVERDVVVRSPEDQARRIEGLARLGFPGAEEMKRS